MATPNIVPRADSEGGIGTASKYWGSAYIDLIYVGAGKIGRDADNLIDFSDDNVIGFRVANSVQVKLSDTALFPVSNSGSALGGSSNRWADLFLDSGAVINFDGGNVTLTHSNNALTLADGDALHFGTDNDLRLFHTSGESLIQNTVGHLYIQNTADDKDIIFSSDDGSGGVTAYLTIDGSETLTQVHKHFKFDDNAQVQLGTGSDLRLYHTGSTSFVMNYVGDVRFINYQDDGDFKFETDDGSGGTTEYFRVDGGENRIVYSQNSRYLDNVIAMFGSGADLQIYHDATDSWIKNSHGNLVFRNTKQNKDIMFQGDDGQASDDTVALYFSLDGSSATHDGSATTALYTNWPDKSRISLGTSHDLQIVHNATDSYIHNHVGDLYIKNTADDKDIIFQSDDGSGGVETYFYLDGSVGGSDPVTRFPDAAQLQFGSGGDAFVKHSGTDFEIGNSTGTFAITQYLDDGDIIFKCDDGSGGVTPYLTLDGSSAITQVHKDIYALDNIKLRAGSDGDLQVYHNGADSYIDNITNNLYIRNLADNKDIVFQSDDGSGGVTTYFRLDGGLSSPHTIFPDGTHIGLGNSVDLAIYHDSANSYLSQNGTGSLILQHAVADGDIIFKADDGTGTVTPYFYLDGGGVLTRFDKKLRASDGVKIEAGSSGDLQIYHDGSNSFIDNATGIFRITQSVVDGDLILRADNGAGSPTPYLTLDGGVNQIHIAKETIFADAILASFGADRDLRIQHSGSNSFIDNYTGTLNFRQRVDDGDIVFSCDDGSGGDTAYLTLDGSQGFTTVQKAIRFDDNVPLQVGSASDFFIQHDGTNTNVQNNTGSLTIRNDQDDGDIIFKSDDGSGGVTPYITLDGTWKEAKFTVDAKWTDSKKARFGSGDDLQIYHDGSNSYISDAGTGSLILQSSDLFLRTNSTENSVVCAANAGVTLYYDNAAKLATTSTGVAVTGGLTTTSTVILSNLPTSDPGTTGQLWNDNGTLKISAGG